MIEPRLQDSLEFWRNVAPCRVLEKSPERVINIAQHELHVLLGVFFWQRAEHKRYEVGRLHAVIEHFYPQRDPRGASGEGIFHVGQMLKQESSSRVVEREIAVGET